MQSSDLVHKPIGAKEALNLLRDSAVNAIGDAENLLCVIGGIQSKKKLSKTSDFSQLKKIPKKPMSVQSNSSFRRTSECEDNDEVVFFNESNSKVNAPILTDKSNSVKCRDRLFRSNGHCYLGREIITTNGQQFESKSWTRGNVSTNCSSVNVSPSNCSFSTQQIEATFPTFEVDDKCRGLEFVALMKAKLPDGTQKDIRLQCKMPNFMVEEVDVNGSKFRRV
ncbi:hypothetical protein M3Y94_01154200 [Aphelenchoides besseyi]|nr:hypothetical protein M3Y94_01154200 [Aphelenchoides besseyi]KAI6227995.1 hypothetical protein M3Y95_00575700 [Aphelenchoides besseyi]